MLFYAIPILEKYFQAEYVYHLSLLVFSMNKLLLNSISTDDLPQVQTHLELFYDLIPELYMYIWYGCLYSQSCTFNNSLDKVCVLLWRPLWTTSTFPYENANGILKRHLAYTQIAIPIHVYIKGCAFQYVVVISSYSLIIFALPKK